MRVHHLRRRGLGWVRIEGGRVVDLDPDELVDVCEEDVLTPEPGERPVFGVHRQVAKAAETAPAWPTGAAFERLYRDRTTRALRNA